MQETTAQVILQNEKVATLQEITEKLNQSADYMQQYVTSKVMEGKMIKSVSHVQKAVKNKDITDGIINKLLVETGVDVIYITDNKGEVKYCNEKGSIGLKLYEVDLSFQALKEGKVKHVATPVKKRFEDGRLFKFLAMIDENGIIFQVGLSIDSLLKF